MPAVFVSSRQQIADENRSRRPGLWLALPLGLELRCGHIADPFDPRFGCFLFQLPPSFHYTPASSAGPIWWQRGGSTVLLRHLCERSSMLAVIRSPENASPPAVLATKYARPPAARIRVLMAAVLRPPTGGSAEPTCFGLCDTSLPANARPTVGSSRRPPCPAGVSTALWATEGLPRAGQAAGLTELPELVRAALPALLAPTGYRHQTGASRAETQSGTSRTRGGPQCLRRRDPSLDLSSSSRLNSNGVTRCHAPSARKLPAMIRVLSATCPRSVRERVVNGRTPTKILEVTTARNEVRNADNGGNSESF